MPQIIAARGGTSADGVRARLDGGLAPRREGHAAAIGHVVDPSERRVGDDHLYDILVGNAQLFGAISDMDAREPPISGVPTRPVTGAVGLMFSDTRSRRRS
jgi:hypothetical protein